MVTTAGRLRFEGVIHAVGPRLGEGDEEDKKDDKTEVEILQEACDGGDARKCNNLGFRYDRGIGLPADRARLFEPYVTTREKGTGLGLPIVKKIIEEHGGTLVLEDAEMFGGTDRPGAKAVVRLPLKALTPAARDAAE